MQRIKVFSLGHCVLLTCAIGFIVLTYYGIVDVMGVIDEYIEDNRATKVKVQNIIGNLPFLDEVVIKWANKERLFSNLSFLNETTITDKISNMLKLTNFDQIPLIELVQLLQLYNRIIINMDEAFPSFRLQALDIAINGSDIFSFLNELVSHSGKMFNLARSVANLVVGKNCADDQLPHKTALSRILPNELTLVIPLQADLVAEKLKWAGDTSTITYIIDYPKESGMINVTFTGLMLSRLANIAVGLPNKTTEVTISISNSGVFNSTSLGQCRLDHVNPNMCKSRIVYQAFVQICDCIPYRGTLKDRKYHTADRDVKFCTFDTYEKCWENVMQEYWRRQNDAALFENCKPCVYWRNTYAVSTKLTDRMDTSGSLRPRLMITFECKEKMYLLFEEQQKISYFQLVSQIGGDLGLFLGCSFITIIELIWFMYKTQKHVRRCQLNSNEHVNIFTRIWRSMRYILVEENVQESVTGDWVIGQIDVKLDKNLKDSQSDMDKKIQDFQSHLDKKLNEIKHQQQIMIDAVTIVKSPRAKSR